MRQWPDLPPRPTPGRRRGQLLAAEPVDLRDRRAEAASHWPDAVGIVEQLRETRLDALEIRFSYQSPQSPSILRFWVPLGPRWREAVRARLGGGPQPELAAQSF
jgi:hypothetical protein